MFMDIFCHVRQIPQIINKIRELPLLFIGHSSRRSQEVG
ncbi:hypothetical protein Y11_43031 [Yersinia enterocolitica subsp. palearctica Y11]|uniref:Uncharacterized protein n=1 Tax=Yersinia enterocolitica subsp. palearctica serotype O:3 (strain DSM 13030 / CIP 106945 / Y11) TaxID=930944 RepID=A0A0H3NXK0_YERE1|nr:hypothetical protein Y11_43031 [Yersinia enterocolitica subsp. palearctica Y11]CCO67107.1 hypothetical protein D322_211 [Yersinia enterocolitica IP 10393]